MQRLARKKNNADESANLLRSLNPVSQMLASQIRDAIVAQINVLQMTPTTHDMLRNVIKSFAHSQENRDPLIQTLFS